MFSAEHLYELLKTGWLTSVPLAIGSALTLAIFAERLLAFRGLEGRTRRVVGEVIDALLERDLERARAICERGESPLGEMILEGLRWREIEIDDLERVFATLRAELAARLRRGIWIIGTVGSLAPFVGLFGTVIGIIRAFAEMAEHGAGGFAVVANGIAEALVATALGLGVAIVALVLFNYLQVRVQGLAGVYARGSERVVQTLLFLESSERAGSAAGS